MEDRSRARLVPPMAKVRTRLHRSTTLPQIVLHAVNVRGMTDVTGVPGTVGTGGPRREYPAEAADAGSTVRDD